MSHRRPFGVLLVFVAVGVTAWGLLHESSRAPLPDAVEDSGDPPAAAPRLEVTGHEPPAPSRDLAVQPENPKIPDQEDPMALRAGRDATGFVRYEDGSIPESFKFWMYSREGPTRGRGWKVKGTTGSFRVAPLAPGPYQIRRVTADGRLPVVLTEQVELVVGEPIEVVIRHRKATGLIIVDAEDGTPLPNAVALLNDKGFRIGPVRVDAESFLPRQPPDMRKRVVADASGFIALPEADGVSSFLVGAPGHVWKQAAVENTTGSTATIRLERGGTVVVRAPFWSEVRSPVLLVTRQGTAVELHRFVFGATKLADADGTIRVEGVPTGGFTFTIGELGGMALVRRYAEGYVDVYAGVEVTLDLALLPAPEERLTQVRGTLRIPKAWRARTWSIYLDGSRDDPATRDRRAKGRVVAGQNGHVVEFETDPVPDGDYVLLLRPINCLARVHIAQGMQPLDVQVPPPIEARVRITDRDSGALVEGARLVYHPTARGVSGGTHHGSRFDGQTGEHVLRCPQGALHLIASAPGYVERAVDVEGQDSSPMRYVVELDRGATLHIRLVYQGTVISAKGAILGVTSPMRSIGRLGRERIAQIDGLFAGTWTVALQGGISGYELPAPVEVVLKNGDDKTIDLELVKEGE